MWAYWSDWWGREWCESYAMVTRSQPDWSPMRDSGATGYTHADSTAGAAIYCYSLWMEPGVAAWCCQLSYRDLKGAERHYRGELRKSQLYANVLWCNTSDTQEKANHAHFNAAESEAQSCLLLGSTREKCRYRTIILISLITVSTTRTTLKSNCKQKQKLQTINYSVM